MSMMDAEASPGSVYGTASWCDRPEIGILARPAYQWVPEVLKRLLRMRGFALKAGPGFRQGRETVHGRRAGSGGESGQNTCQETAAQPGTEGQWEVRFFRHRILVYRSGSFLYRLPIERGSRPLNRGAALYDGALYYGDYWSNRERESVRLHKVDLETGERQVAFRFEKVRHIHFVDVDRYRAGALLLGTGDRDEESGIYRFYLETGEIETLLSGSQSYRAVSVLQRPQWLFWGSDDPDGRNFIYRFEKESGRAEELREIDGPAYYSTEDGWGRMYIASTIEDRKRHRAVIYRSNDGGESWREQLEFEKDLLPTKYFGHGIVDFPANEEYVDELSYRLFGGLREKRSVSAGARNDFRPVFIVGVGRSGTSLLQGMLNAHSRIAFPPETHYLRRYIVSRVGLARGTAAQDVWAPPGSPLRGRLLEDPYLANLGLDLEPIISESNSPVDFYVRLMRSYAAARGKDFAGDKDPKNIEYLRTIAKIFPKALLVHIYRDPRAVIASRMKAEWSKDKPLWQQILAYRAQYGYMRAREGLFGDRYIAVRYEDLVADPRAELSKILEKMKLDFEDGMLEFFRHSDELVKGRERRWKENLYRPVTGSTVEKWRSQLTVRRRRAVERALYREMEEGGYDGGRTNPLVRGLFSAAARIYCLLSCR